MTLWDWQRPYNISGGVLIPAGLKSKIELLEYLHQKILTIRDRRRNLIVQKKMLGSSCIVGFKNKASHQMIILLFNP
jgi:hypothetical protein